MNRKVFLKLALAGASALAMSFGVAMAEPIKIAVANFGDHPQLNAVIDGFKAELAGQFILDHAPAQYQDDYLQLWADFMEEARSTLQSDAAYALKDALSLLRRECHVTA